MLTTDPAVINLAKKNFATWADAADVEYTAAVSAGLKAPIYNYRKATWENVSKGTRKRYVREATATVARIREEATKEADRIARDATMASIEAENPAAFVAPVPTEEQIKNETAAIYEATTADLPREQIPDYVVEERTTIPGLAPAIEHAGTNTEVL